VEFFPGAKPARMMVKFGADISGVLVAIGATGGRKSLLAFALRCRCARHDLRSRKFCRRRGLDQTPGSLPTLLRRTKRPFS
jgi:hypothetical protein